MKKIFLFSFLLPCIAFSQKIAVIDRQLATPVVYVEDASFKQIQQGHFLIYQKDINVVMDSIASIRTYIASHKKGPRNANNFVTGNTYFSYFKKGRKYSIAMDTKSDKMGSYFVLFDPKKSQEENLQHMDKLLAYLKSN